MFELFKNAYNNYGNDWKGKKYVHKYNLMFYATYILGIFVFISFILCIVFDRNYYYLTIILFVIICLAITKNNKDYYESLLNDNDYMKQHLEHTKSRIIYAKNKAYINNNMNNELYKLIENEYIERKRGRHKTNPNAGVERIILPAIISLLSSTLTGEFVVYFKILIVLYCVYYIMSFVTSIITIYCSNIGISYLELEELYNNYYLIINIK